MERHAWKFTVGNLRSHAKELSLIKKWYNLHWILMRFAQLSLIIGKKSKSCKFLLFCENWLSHKIDNMVYAFKGVNCRRIYSPVKNEPDRELINQEYASSIRPIFGGSLFYYTLHDLWYIQKITYSCIFYFLNKDKKVFFTEVTVTSFSVTQSSNGSPVSTNPSPYFALIRFWRTSWIAFFSSLA